VPLKSVSGAHHAGCSLVLAKTELVWFGSGADLTKLARYDCSLSVRGNIIKPSYASRVLGSELLDRDFFLKI